VPPRHAYWTILIDDKPTAFRARERDELQPTLVQLQRKNANVTMRWFARGKLWASREAEHEDFQRQKFAATERRGSDWRPGGTHKDPRDRFKKKNRPERAWSEKDPATQRDRDKPGFAAHRPFSGWRNKPQGPPRNDPRRRPPDNRPPGSFVPSDRPWQTKPTGPRAQRKPWVGKPGPASGSGGFKPRGDRPWTNKPPAGEKRPWSPKPPPGGGGGKPPSGDRRPWSGKPRTENRGGFSSGSPARGDQKPWQKKPFRPGGPPRPDSRGRHAGPRKRRDDEPPDRD
jgi:23S rRNA pseudouridine2605 synthase